MTKVYKLCKEFNEYRVLEFLEEQHCMSMRNCSLEEVLYILSTKEGSINVQKLAD